MQKPYALMLNSMGAAACLLGLAAPAVALTVSFSGQSRVIVENGYEQPFGVPMVPMLPPGDVAMIDDWFHNTSLIYNEAVPGDSLGIRATSPTGVISSNTVTRGTTTNCWFAGLTQYCPAYSSGEWYLGTTIRFKAVGQWKVDVLNNGAVVNTFFFQLKPYNLLQDSASTQSIPIKTTAPQPLTVRVTTPDGAPAEGKTVTFNVTSRPRNPRPAGGVKGSDSYSGTSNSTLPVQTTSDGKAVAYFEAGGKEGTYVVTATSALAPGITRTFTITATGTTDATDSASLEKNLGLDPVNNSSCAKQSNPFSPNPINLATGNKTALEADYQGAGPFPLTMSRVYNSFTARPGRFGNNWRGFYDRAIVVTTTTVKNKTTTVAEAVRHDGRVLKFTLTNNVWVAEPDIVDRLVSVGGGGFRLTCGSDQAETYAANGQLTSVSAREGFQRPPGPGDRCLRPLARLQLRRRQPHLRHDRSRRPCLCLRLHGLGQPRLGAVPRPHHARVSLREHQLPACAHRHDRRERRALHHLLLQQQRRCRADRACRRRATHQRAVLHRRQPPAAGRQ
jgi:hypothetical protein